jgi:hypothetical protein
MATAADLVLPRLPTGEALTAADLTDLAHGGVLGGEMRFLVPPLRGGAPGARRIGDPAENHGGCSRIHPEFTEAR